MNARYAAMALSLVGALVIATPAVAEQVTVGTAPITRDFQYAGTTLSKGRYEVLLDIGADTYFVLRKDGREVLRELAIVQGGQPRVSRARVGVAYPSKDEKLVKLIVRSGTNRYLAFFERTP